MLDIITQDQVDIKSNVEKLELYSEDYPFSLSFRIKNFEDEKQFVRYIKNCERLVRSSVEYKLWREYITAVLHVNECALTHESMGELSIEIHHHIPSLFVLIKSVILKTIENKKDFSTFDICLECLEIHFKNQIGYIPLISSLHEKFHNNFLELPIEMVKGNYKGYINEYSRYLDETDIETINARLNVKLENVQQAWIKNNYPGIVNG